MSAPAPNIDIGSQTLDNISFAPIYPTKDCGAMKIICQNFNANNLLVRSDPTDANSELTLSEFSKFPEELAHIINSPKYRAAVPFIYGKLSGIASGVIKKICY